MAFYEFDSINSLCLSSVSYVVNLATRLYAIFEWSDKSAFES